MVHQFCSKSSVASSGFTLCSTVKFAVDNSLELRDFFFILHRRSHSIINKLTNSELYGTSILEISGSWRR